MIIDSPRGCGVVGESMVDARCAPGVLVRSLAVLFLLMTIRDALSQPVILTPEQITAAYCMGVMTYRRTKMANLPDDLKRQWSTMLSFGAAYVERRQQYFGLILRGVTVDTSPIFQQGFEREHDCHSTSQAPECLQLRAACDVGR